MQTDTRVRLLLSAQKALLGAVHPQLRQVSVDADEQQKIVTIRFEYDGSPNEEVWEACSVVATEVIADFQSPWDIDEQHLAAPAPSKLNGLPLVVYKRGELL